MRQQKGTGFLKGTEVFRLKTHSQVIRLLKLVGNSSYQPLPSTPVSLAERRRRAEGVPSVLLICPHLKGEETLCYVLLFVRFKSELLRCLAFTAKRLSHLAMFPHQRPGRHSDHVFGARRRRTSASDVAVVV